MSDLDRDDLDDDPWLTVAEIADELRVNPATVRLWISKEKLPAKRAGQRKLLIRRSDLDHMLDLARNEPPARRSQPRPRDPQFPLGMGPPQSLDQLSTADIHGRQVSPDEMQQIVEELRLADEVWDHARTVSEKAPPDPGFPHRLRGLAEGCDQQAKSLARAGWIEGFAWTPIPNGRYMSVSPELRPGANRPGPPELWEQFDQAVQRLGIAMEGRIMYVVAFRYQDLAAVMHKIADLLLGETPDPRGQGA